MTIPVAYLTSSLRVIPLQFHQDFLRQKTASIVQRRLREDGFSRFNTISPRDRLTDRTDRQTEIV